MPMWLPHMRLSDSESGSGSGCTALGQTWEAWLDPIVFLWTYHTTCMVARMLDVCTAQNSTAQHSNGRGNHRNARANTPGGSITPQSLQLGMCRMAACFALGITCTQRRHVLADS